MEKYRGLEDVIDAMAHLKMAGVTGTLVIAGTARPEMQGYLRKLRRGAARAKIDDRVFFAGHLSAEEMAWCYQQCGVFVTTSRVESFGLVNIEALRHGCLCVAANNASLPEIFGGAATYYRPGDALELASAIQDAHRRFGMDRESAQRVSRERAARFRWDDAVEQFVSLFQECC